MGNSNLVNHFLLRITLFFTMKRLFLLTLILFLSVLIYAIQGQSPTPFNWKTANFTQIPIPKDITEGARQGSCYRLEENFADVEGTRVHYKESNPTAKAFLPSGQSILLLHGAAYTSATWKDSIPTLQILACLGYHVIAIDLPGFGQTGQSPFRGKIFLQKAIDHFFKKNKPVVVSPSMSGSFSLPLLVSKPNYFGGFIPVAPVGTSTFTNEYSEVGVPTLIVYGKDDFGARRSNEYLSMLPNSTTPQGLEKAGHPAYLDQPDVWHTLIHNFMLLLN